MDLLGSSNQRPSEGRCTNTLKLQSPQGAAGFLHVHPSLCLVPYSPARGDLASSALITQGWLCALLQEESYLGLRNGNAFGKRKKWQLAMPSLSKNSATTTGIRIKVLVRMAREFPGSPVVRAPLFHCRGCGFDSWWGN